MILEDGLYDLLVIPEDLICIRCFNKLLWLICRNEILIYNNNNCILDNKNMNLNIERVCNSYIDMNGVIVTYILSKNNIIQQISYDKTKNIISIKQISMKIPSNKIVYIDIIISKYLILFTIPYTIHYYLIDNNNNNYINTHDYEFSEPGQILSQNKSLVTFHNFKFEYIIRCGNYSNNCAYLSCGLFGNELLCKNEYDNVVLDNYDNLSKPILFSISYNNKNYAIITWYNENCTQSYLFNDRIMKYEEIAGFIYDVYTQYVSSDSKNNIIYQITNDKMNIIDKDKIIQYNIPYTLFHTIISTDNNNNNNNFIYIWGDKNILVLKYNNLELNEIYKSTMNYEIGYISTINTNNHSIIFISEWSSSIIYVYKMMDDNSLKEIGSSKINTTIKVGLDSQIQYVSSFDMGNSNYDLFMLYNNGMILLSKWNISLPNQFNIISYLPNCNIFTSQPLFLSNNSLFIPMKIPYILTLNKSQYKITVLNNSSNYTHICPVISNTTEITLLTITYDNIFHLCSISTESNVYYTSTSISDRILSLSNIKDDKYLSLNSLNESNQTVLAVYDISSFKEIVHYKLQQNHIIYSHKLVKYKCSYFIITVSEIVTPEESSLSTSTPKNTIISLWLLLLLDNKENNLILQFHREYPQCSYSQITSINDNYYVITVGRELYVFKLDGEYDSIELKEIYHYSCVSDIIECKCKNSIVFIELYTNQRIFYSFNEKTEKLILIDNYKGKNEDKNGNCEITEPKFLLIKE